MGGNRLLSFTFSPNGNLCNIGHEQSIISAWGYPVNGRMGPFSVPGTPPTFTNRPLMKHLLLPLVAAFLLHTESNLPSPPFL